MHDRASHHSASGARVLLFVADLGATGVVRNAIALANHLSEEGYRVTLATCRAEGVLRCQLGLGVDVIELLQPGTRAGPRWAELVRSLAAFRSQLRRMRPDIIMSVGNHGHILTRLAASAAPEARVVYRVSNDLDHMLAGRPESRLGRFLRHAQFRFVSRGADRLALVSPHLARHPLVAGQRSGKKVWVIQNGVEVDAVREAARGPCRHPWLQGDGPPTLLAIGRFAAQKNYPTLLRALAVAQRTRAMRLIIIGDGSPAAREHVIAQARQLGVADALDIIAPLSNPFSWIAKASALVLPSWWEGSSNVLLETLACGTPVIASTSAGNAASVLGYGKFGLTVDPADPEAMAEAILNQTGAAPVLPGSRAEAFDHCVTMASYSELIAQLGTEAGFSVSRATKPSSTSGKSSRPPVALATAATRARPRPVPGIASVPRAR